MKYTKNIFLFVLLLLCLLLCPSVALAASTATISAGTVEGEPGTTVTVPIEIKNNTGFVSASLIVEYDSNVLTLREVKDTGLIPGALHTTSYKSPYYLTWVNDNATTNYSNNGTLVNLVFEVLENAVVGEYTIRVYAPEDGVLCIDGSEFVCEYADGKVTIPEKECQHSWGEWKRANNTKHKRTCSLCGEAEYERHDWDEGEITEEPTEEAPGLKVYTCEVCGGTKSEVLDALPHEHDMVRTPAKTPTCKEEGNNEYYTCRKCDKVYKDEDGTEETTVEEETLPKSTTHTSEVVLGKEPTCTEPGLTDGEKCSVCGKILVEQDPIDPTGHTWGQWEKYDAVYHIRWCECGESEKKAHNWDEGVVVKKPSATEPGTRRYTCESCGEILETNIPALGECDGGENCPLQRFVDVDSSHWAHKGIDFVVNNGLMNGTGDGTKFEPEMSMSRAMLVTVLHRYAGSPYAGESGFVDVVPGDWFYAGVSWAANNGVVNGVGDGSRFDPNGDVTREMMATILFRYASKIGVDTSKRADISGYPDEANVAGWSREAVRWAVAEGIISGAVKDGQTVLAPQDSANRAVVATIMMRFIQNVVEGN